MSTPAKLALLLVLVIAAGAGAYLAYDQVLRGDSTPALSLPSTSPGSSAAPTTAASSTTPADSSAPSGSTAASTLTAATAAGTWNIGSGSLAGYRVRERLATLSAESDAVGRTDKVTGTATLTTSGTSATLTAASVTVDTTSIASDKSQRDDRLRREGLQTDQYPTATFTLTAPATLPSNAFDGSVVDVTLHGDLTIHGVTKSVDIPAKAQVSGSTIAVQGSISFPLSDYGMTAPNLGGFILSIADTGTLEFVVVLDRG